MINSRIASLLLGLVTALTAKTAHSLQAQNARVEVFFGERMGPMEMDHMALGQGGLSDEPMWSDRVAEVRALRPKIIRLFIQEYFDLLPVAGSYHFETLDRSVDTILRAGSKPLMCICFKPRLLFPKVDQDVVEPQDYAAWEDLIYALVKHYRERRAGIQYWEIANEPDIGEDGGCPCRFKPENYVRYYQHTAAAILRGDPAARIGGPALASSHSPILPTLLSFCETNQVPLHFVSWHIYSSDPQSIRSTVDYVRSLLKEYSGLKPETILDEWNMDLTNPPLDPRFQPAFVAETIWQMKEAGLDYSCYYHIRDWYVNFDQFRPFMSEQGAAFMARWWNRMPQFDGLFDYQNQVRPAYYGFKLLSRLAGERLRVTSDHSVVHGFATHDEQLRSSHLLLWNFSPEAVTVELALKGLSADSRTRHIVLDAVTSSMDENSRLRPDPFSRLEKGDHRLDLKLEPYAIHYWYFE
jgi:xylan 1,4-beta-xylosidase